jgi:hypothetical protein
MHSLPSVSPVKPVTVWLVILLNRQAELTTKKELNHESNIISIKILSVPPTRPVIWAYSFFLETLNTNRITEKFPTYKNYQPFYLTIQYTDWLIQNTINNKQ